MMKTPRYLLLTVGLAGMLSVIGCATHGYQRATHARNTIEDARNLVLQIQQEIDQTTSSLDELIAPKPGSLKPPFKDYEFALKRMQRNVDRIPRHRQAIRKQADAYSETWEKELASIQTVSIRERSAARHTEVKQELNALDGDFAALEKALGPLMLHLRDMDRFLRTDLTTPGTDSGSVFVKRIRADGEDVNRTAKSLVEKLNRVENDLAPVRPSPESPEAKG